MGFYTYLENSKGRRVSIITMKTVKDILKERYYENPQILHENTMPARAYYIPSSKRMDNLVRERETSDRFILLSGNWKFRYYKSIFDLKDDFYEDGFDVNAFDEIKVPGAFQMQGYDYQQYTNLKYPITFDPPYVPQDNPCGVYVCDFDYSIDKNAPKAFLNFEGVDSAFYVWINGAYVGYSQVPHMTSEFDVTGVLKEGSNRIAVLNLKYSDGTYLEDQDKFRMSGIIRDVYILNRPNECVYDYFIKQELVDSKGNRAKFTEDENITANVNIEFSYLADKAACTEVEVFDKKGLSISKGRVNDLKYSFSVNNPELWNQENPYLYTVVITTDKEVIVDRIGFRTIEIIDRVVYLNGRKIKLSGVNRHESDPVTGPSISINQLMKDLKLIREFNFNAIRTSHYPNAPYFYQICDELGFLICDEADIEAHGPSEIYRKDDSWYNHCKRWNEQLADDPGWEDAITDRVMLMVKRDKNRPCVVIWSMGNESAYGCNFEKALKLTKDYDPSRITQYESSRYRDYDKKYDFSNLDTYSRMYPSFEEMDEYFTRDEIKPFILIEYSHSMGNGPGDFEEYFEYIENNDSMMGGFIWEWCDHTIYKGKAANGKDMYYYGGDHGETVHDGNFCMDGLVYPDRTPHTGVYEYKNVHRPARVKSFDKKSGNIIIHNYLTFTNLEDYADISYEINVDGDVVKTGNISGFSVAPLSDGVLRIEEDFPEKGKVYLRIIYTNKTGSELVDKGHELGFDEVPIENEDGRNQKVVALLCGDNKYEPQINNCPDYRTVSCDKIECTNNGLSVEETLAEVIVSGSNFSYTFSKKTGMINSLINNNKEYLDRPAIINTWRAPTDNDISIKNTWKKACYHMSSVRAYTVDVIENNGCAANAINSVDVKVKASVGAPTVQKFMDLNIIYSINESGAIYSKIDVKKDDEFPELPRFGVRMFLKNELNEVSYYGLGPNESYVDKRRASYHSIFSNTVTGLHEDYIRPQENGSHDECDFVKLSGKMDDTASDSSLTVASLMPFSFNVSKFTQEELETKKHNFELEESGSTVLCIDKKLNGIGSNSCGPGLEQKYRFDECEFTLEYSIIFE